VTSASACVMPLDALIAACRRAGVPVLVDGAHAPGMLPLALDALGADWYTGNCHKWLFAPKGAAFLYARRERRDGLHPLVISHGLGKGLHAEFDWPGTRDFTAWLAIPDGIAFHRDHDSAALSAHNRALAHAMGSALAARWGTELAVPPDLLGSMATVRVPLAARPPDRRLRRRGAGVGARRGAVAARLGADLQRARRLPAAGRRRRDDLCLARPPSGRRPWWCRAAR